MNTPLAIVNLGSTGNVPAAIQYFSDRKKVGKFMDGLHTGAAVGDSKQLAELLLSNHHNPRGRRVARTAVISVQTPRRATRQELEDIDQRLIQAFGDLQKLLQVPMLGWTHHNTQTRHLHVIFPNSNGVRCLDLRPQFLRQLQGFTWTMALLSGRGRGRRQALSAYPKSKKLAARDLAGLLLDAQGNFRQDRWNALVKSGAVTHFRQRNDGSLISFEYGGKRCRVATLKGFVIECQNTRHQNEEPKHENSFCRPGNGQALAPNSQPGRGPATDRNGPALPGKTGPGQRGTLPPPAPAKPTALATPALPASRLEPCTGGEPAGDSTGTPELEPTGSSPLPPGGLAGGGRPKRRSQVRPAGFQRPSRPSIGGL